MLIIYCAPGFYTRHNTNPAAKMVDQNWKYNYFIPSRQMGFDLISLRSTCKKSTTVFLLVLPTETYRQVPPDSYKTVQDTIDQKSGKSLHQEMALNPPSTNYYIAKKKNQNEKKQKQVCIQEEESPCDQKDHECCQSRT